jgi:peptide/nickel transport system permease protein
MSQQMSSTVSGTDRPARRQARSGWSPTMVVGTVLLTLILAGVVFAPFLTGFDPSAISRETLQAPSALHILGTDELGRDVLSRVFHGGRASLAVGILSGLIAIVIGVSLGLVAGLTGGLIDEALMRFTEVFQVLPRLLVAIVVVALLGGGQTTIILVIGLLSWPPTARIIRTQALSIRHEEFVSAAILSGATFGRLMIRHLLPNVLPFVIVSASMQIANAILSEAALSFLGLGDATHPSWGLMLQQSQSYLRQAWWMSAFPGMALALSIFGLNIMSDALGRKLQGSA